MTLSKKTFRPPKAIIVSVSSGIGFALAQRWATQGFEIAGTYRTDSAAVEKLKKLKVKMYRCDLSDKAAVGKVCSQLRRHCSGWDRLVLCPGTLEPVGPFAKVRFEAWRKSLEVNFLDQMRVVYELLPARHSQRTPAVLFFAGGGTNNATLNYSAYTVSKIALIKMCELLDAEIPDVKFAIVGPGFVDTKIHRATFKAGPKAGDNYGKTIRKLKTGECTAMEKVLDCCDWLMQSPRQAVSGRNFSTVFDAWSSKALTDQLLRDPHMYKLRRHGNDWKE